MGRRKISAASEKDGFCARSSNGLGGNHHDLLLPQNWRLSAILVCLKLMQRWSDGQPVSVIQLRCNGLEKTS